MIRILAGSLPLLMLACQNVAAGGAEQAEQAAEAARAAEAQAVAAYEQALLAAETEQRAALDAVEAARSQLQVQATERQASIAREADRASLETTRRQAQDMSEVRRELERAHNSLRRATREVARVHREINRPHLSGHSVSFGDQDRAVIGVVLGASVADGVVVLGVSPDGPAERAGLVPGDVITSLMGEELAGGEEDARAVLGEVMKGVKVGDELQVVVERDGDIHEFTLHAEKREPFTWHSYTRLPSIPGDVDTAVIVESIEIPEIDREALAGKLARLREDLAHTRIAADASRALRFHHEGEGYVYEFEEFSELGDAMLAGTNMWFGMPLTRGLKMTELGAGLGGYFNADRGVLVLEARDDNGLQLQAGDVILSVSGREVNRPADVMRALRDVESGARLEIEVMRRHESQLLSIEVTRENLGWNFDAFPNIGLQFEFDSEASG